MATKTFTGTLKGPLGDTLGNARILFVAVRTSPTVVEGSNQSAVAAADGTYSVTVEYGRYDILVRPQGARSHFRIADGVVVNQDVVEDNLNDLAITDQIEWELTSEVMAEFRALKDETVENRAHVDSQVVHVDDQVAHVDSQVVHVDDQVAFVDQRATDADTSAQESASSATDAASSATNAASSATDAQASEDEAEQWSTSLTEVEPGLYGARKYAQDADSAASAASTSEANAADSETAAADSATAASTSETNAAASETAVSEATALAFLDFEVTAEGDLVASYAGQIGTDDDFRINEQGYLEITI